MRLVAAMLASLVLAAPARGEGRNDSVRRGSGPSSDHYSRSGDRDDALGAACDAVSCLCNLFDAAATAAPPAEVVPGPYAVPPPPPGEPVHAQLLAGLGDALGGNPTLVPRLDLSVDLPVGYGGLRIELAHEGFEEIVPADGATRAHWDSLPLSTARVGWVFRGRHLETALLAGGRLLWTSTSPEAGLDLGLAVRYEDGAFFASLVASGMAIDPSAPDDPDSRPPLLAVEADLRFGLVWHAVELGAGWHHTAFASETPAVYSGPELTLALRR